MTEFDQQEFLQYFCEDAQSFLENIQAALEAIKEKGWSDEAYEEAWRAAHSLAGTAGTLNYKTLARLGSTLEEILDATRGTEDPDERSNLLEIASNASSMISEAIQRLCNQEEPEALIPEIEESLDRMWKPAETSPEPQPNLEAELETADQESLADLAEELAEWEPKLSQWASSESPPEGEEEDQLRRLIHTVVGSAATVGLNTLSSWAESLESTLLEEKQLEEVWEKVQKLLRHLSGIAARAAGGAQATGVDAETLADFRAEAAELLENAEHLLMEVERGELSWEESKPELMRILHTLKGIAQTVGYEFLAEAAHMSEDVVESGGPEVVGIMLDGLDLLRSLAEGIGRPAENFAKLASLIREGAKPTAAAEPITPPTEELLRIPVSRLDTLMNLVGELVINRTRMASKIEALEGLRAALRASQERLVRLVEAFRRRHEYRSWTPESEERSQALLDFSVLELDRYDDLNILSRSLMEISDDTSEIMQELENLFGSFAEETEALQRITNTLQDEITRVRMVPVARLLRRLERPAWEVAKQEGKAVKLELAGADVEVDRPVLDRLFPAMVHLVRNAVAHGIEPPEHRAKLGKPETGTVVVGAEREGENVALFVRDDGRGVDEAAVREAAKKMGLDPERELSELLVASGLSTLPEADKGAGRGVGMAVVREVVRQLNGRLEIKTSPGKGTEVRLIVPTTLAVHQALVVLVGSERYAIPLAWVERAISVAPGDVQPGPEGPSVLVDQDVLPLKSLAALLGVPSPPEAGMAEHPAIVVRMPGGRTALLVDRILAREEVVVKRLGPLLDGHPFVSGGTLAGDGSIIPVLEVGGLVRVPLAAVPIEEQPVAFPTPEARPGKAVLLVDDSLSIRKAARKMAAGTGIELVTASDGLQALELLRERPFQLVITDLEMPRMNGYELIAAMKRHPDLARIPVVVLSSRASEKHRRYAEKLGAEGYIVKPLTRQDLLRWVPGEEQS